MNFTQLINGIEICDNAFDEKIINTFYSKIKNNCFHFWGKSEPNDEPSFWKLPLFVEEKNWTNKLIETSRNKKLTIWHLLDFKRR